MGSLFDDYQTIANSGLFDAEFYLRNNPDLAALNVDPLMHYMETGAREGRNPHENFDTAFYLEQCRQLGERTDNALLHFISDGAFRGLKPRRETQIPPARLANFLAAIDEAVLDRDGDSGVLALTAQGWALAATPIAEITIAVDGAGSCRASYGLARPDVAQIHPLFPKADQSGFAFSLGRIPDAMDGAIALEVTARTSDGQTHRVSIPISAKAAERRGNGAAAPSVEPTGLRRPPMQLHVDQLSVDERGILQVEGWAVSLAPLVSVQLFLEEERIGAADYGKPREDVAASHPEFPNARFSGFRFKTDLRRFGSGRKSLKIQAISLGGITRELIVPVEIADRAEPAHVPAAAGEEQNSLLHCDAIQLASDGRIAVAGWAIGRAPTEAIAVLVDGAEAGLAEIGLDRPDVGNHFPTIAHARLSGFKFAAKLERTFEGEHLVVLRIKSSGEEREIPLPVLAVEVAAEAPSTPTAGLTDGSDLKLVVDAPAVVGGAVASPVRNRLEINGWALARAGVASVDIALDGNHLLSAYYGVRRIDVQSAFPDWGDALGSGFTAMLPQRVLPKGRRLIGVTLRDKAGKTATVEFHVEVEEPPEHFGPWSLRRRLPQAEINFATHMLAERDWRPAFTLVMPVANGDDAASVERSVACARAQAYADWRLLLAPEGGSRNARRLCDDVIAGTQGGDARVQILPRSARQSPGALVAEGGFLGILKPGDELGCDALMEMALTSSVHRDADFIYADDRRVNPATGALDAFFKPQWSPDLVLSTNYIGRTWWARADLVGRLAASVDDLLQHGDWDIVLRATELARAVRHIPAVLCEMSAAANDDARAERAALARAMKRRRIAGKVEAGRAPGAHRMRRDVTTKGLVSIIIPTCAARGLIKTCLETLRKMTAYRNFEIICIENIPDDQRRWKRWVRAHADKVVETHEPFNWSRFNNLAAAEAKGEFLLFLNDDIEIIAPDWLDALLEHAQRTRGRRRRPAAPLSGPPGAACGHVPRRHGAGAPRLPLRARGRARIFRSRLDATQRHRRHRCLPADAARDFRRAGPVRRGPQRHQQRPRLLPQGVAPRPRQRLHAAFAAHPSRADQPRPHRRGIQRGRLRQHLAPRVRAGRSVFPPAPLQGARRFLVRMGADPGLLRRPSGAVARRRAQHPDRQARPYRRLRHRAARGAAAEAAFSGGPHFGPRGLVLGSGVVARARRRRDHRPSISSMRARSWAAWKSTRRTS